MHILNYSHPLTEAQLAQIEMLAGEAIVNLHTIREAARGRRS